MMAACEKCWGDAYVRTQIFGGHQANHYRILLEERKDTPCTSTEQAGTSSTPVTPPGAVLDVGALCKPLSSSQARRLATLRPTTVHASSSSGSGGAASDPWAAEERQCEECGRTRWDVRARINLPKGPLLCSACFRDRQEGSL